MSSNTLVIKVGGELLQKPDIAIDFLHVLEQLQQRFLIVLVHGGGALVEELMQSLNLPSEKYQGLRITPDEHMKYIAGALGGTANKQLCALAQRAGLNTVGLCLADGGMIVSHPLSEHLGAVGDATPANDALPKLLLQQGYLPVVSSIGADGSGRLLNVNADQAATALATLLHARLFLLSNVTGVLDSEQQLCEQLDPQQVDKMVADGVIADGMLVKVKAAQDAANTLNQAVTIASWQQPSQLLGLLSGDLPGTRILPSNKAAGATP
ncbi:acetylglutamate kinase [Aestuariibacter salexigens]|uniref:acetylglutamate kinase n=1 Tax=Aestuariibacter salexigens TaxID=226010 RepID=UPI0004257114|nr:acetylglutamate kinase [Aestuariibacter salexigens]